MIDPESERICADVRTDLGFDKIPVDVIGIAQAERIELEPDIYGEDFHGRIEFLPEERVFVLYYPREGEFGPSPRVRFSIAHELGHFYLPAHREGLLRGQRHDSVAGFLSDRERERAADCFAACLLVPRWVMDERIRRKGFMDMPDLLKMAKDLEVSLPAAAIRYVQYAEEKCGAVMSANGRMKYYLASDEMRRIGLGMLPRDFAIPAASTARALLMSGKYREVLGTATSTDIWFANRRGSSLKLWEDSVALGYGGQVLSLLSVDKRIP